MVCLLVNNRIYPKKMISKSNGYRYIDLSSLGSLRGNLTHFGRLNIDSRFFSYPWSLFFNVNEWMIKMFKISYSNESE